MALERAVNVVFAPELRLVLVLCEQEEAVMSFAESALIRKLLKLHLDDKPAALPLLPLFPAGK